MFRQFAISRFMIGFIIFVLTYMVATLSYDTFFHWITAGMFVLHLYIMREIKEGQKEELAKKDLEWEEKVLEIQQQLDQKEAEYDILISTIVKSGANKLGD